MNFHRRMTGAKAVTPQTLIQLTFDICAGDRQAAAQAVREAAKTNAALAEYLLDVGARTVVGNLICSDRKDIVSGNPTANVSAPRYVRSKPDTTAHVRRTNGRAALEIKMLLDMTLYGGNKRMGDATKFELLESASKYDAQSADMRIKAIHQRFVAAALPDGMKVSAKMTNEDLTALWEKARAEVQIPA